MQIVINIDDEKYNVIKSELYNTFSAEMKEWGLEAIRRGVPLPKGYGRLIDADKYLETERPRGLAEETWKESYTYKSIMQAPTVLKAESEKS